MVSGLPLMPDVELDPRDYRDLGAAPKPRYSVLDYLVYGLPAWWKINQTDQRDLEFEKRQGFAIFYGLGLFLMHKLRGGSP